MDGMRPKLVLTTYEPELSMGSDRKGRLTASKLIKESEIYVFGKSYFGFYVLFILCLIPSPDRTWSHILHVWRQPGMSYHPFIWIIQQNVFHISAYFNTEYWRRVKDRSSLTFHLKSWPSWLIYKIHSWTGVCTQRKIVPLSHVYSNTSTVPPQNPPVLILTHTKIKIMILWFFSHETSSSSKGVQSTCSFTGTLNNPIFVHWITSLTPN